MKLSKQELKQKISDSIKDNDDLVISLLEDIEDSMTEDGTDTVMMESLKKENEDLKFQNGELKQKYKERFLSGPEEKEETTEETGLEEKEVIDVKDLY